MTEVVICKVCGDEFLSTTFYCETCGVELVKCPSCGSIYDLDGNEHYC